MVTLPFTEIALLEVEFTETPHAGAFNVVFPLLLSPVPVLPKDTIHPLPLPKVPTARAFTVTGFQPNALMK
jgi:hypothetical protein